MELFAIYLAFSQFLVSMAVQDVSVDRPHVIPIGTIQEKPSTFKSAAPVLSLAIPGGICEKDYDGIGFGKHTIFSSIRSFCNIHVETQAESGKTTTSELDIINICDLKGSSKICTFYGLIPVSALTPALAKVKDSPVGSVVQEIAVEELVVASKQAMIELEVEVVTQEETVTVPVAETVTLTTTTTDSMAITSGEEATITITELITSRVTQTITELYTATAEESTTSSRMKDCGNEAPIEMPSIMISLSEFAWTLLEFMDKFILCFDGIAHRLATFATEGLSSVRTSFMSLTPVLATTFSKASEVISVAWIPHFTFLRLMFTVLLCTGGYILIRILETLLVKLEAVWQLGDADGYSTESPDDDRKDDLGSPVNKDNRNGTDIPTTTLSPSEFSTDEGPNVLDFEEGKGVDEPKAPEDERTRRRRRSMSPSPEYEGEFISRRLQNTIKQSIEAQAQAANNGIILERRHVKVRHSGTGSEVFSDFEHDGDVKQYLHEKKPQDRLPQRDTVLSSSNAGEIRRYSVSTLASSIVDGSTTIDALRAQNRPGARKTSVPAQDILPRSCLHRYSDLSQKHFLNDAGKPGIVVENPNKTLKSKEELNRETKEKASKPQIAERVHKFQATQDSWLTPVVVDREHTFTSSHGLASELVSSKEVDESLVTETSAMRQDNGPSTAVYEYTGARMEPPNNSRSDPFHASQSSIVVPVVEDAPQTAQDLSADLVSAIQAVDWEDTCVSDIAVVPTFQSSTPVTAHPPIKFSVPTTAPSSFRFSPTGTNVSIFRSVSRVTAPPFFLPPEPVTTSVAQPQEKAREYVRKKFDQIPSSSTGFTSPVLSLPPSPASETPTDSASPLISSLLASSVNQLTASSLSPPQGSRIVAALLTSTSHPGEIVSTTSARPSSPRTNFVDPKYTEDDVEEEEPSSLPPSPED